MYLLHFTDEEPETRDFKWSPRTWLLSGRSETFTWSLGFQILCIFHEASPFYGSMCNFNMVLSIVMSQLARFSESSPALSSKADPGTQLPWGNVCAPLLRQASEDLSWPHCHVPSDYPVFCLGVKAIIQQILRNSENEWKLRTVGAYYFYDFSIDINVLLFWVGFAESRGGREHLEYIRAFVVLKCIRVFSVWWITMTRSKVVFLNYQFYVH